MDKIFTPWTTLPPTPPRFQSCFPCPNSLDGWTKEINPPQHDTVGGRNPAPLYLHPKTNPRTPSLTLGQFLVVRKKKLNDQILHHLNDKRHPTLGGKGDAQICPSYPSKCWCRISSINRMSHINIWGRRSHASLFLRV